MKLSVLIVEDETLVAMEIAQSVKLAGFEVCGIAHKSETAYKLIHKQRPHIIVMDINLGEEESGIDIASNIHRHLDSAIIYLTAYHDQKTLEDASKTNFIQYILKPYNKAELISTLKLTALRCQTYSVNLGNNYTYKPHTKELTCKDKIITLTNNEQLLFHLLFQARNNLVSSEILDYEIWPTKIVSDTTRRTLVHRLRQKIDGLTIEKVSNVGYRLLY